MKVKVLPGDAELEIDSQKSLLQIFTENKIEIKSLCKGKPSCAECRIKLVSGESSVNPPSQAEISLIGTNYYLDGRRLSCQLYCFGDVTVDITEQIDRQDSSAKKIRGFRGQTKSTSESQAKRDTFVLAEDSRVEGSVDASEPDSSPPNSRQQQRPQQSPRRQQDQRQGPQNQSPRNRNNNRRR